MNSLLLGFDAALQLIIANEPFELCRKTAEHGTGMPERSEAKVEKSVAGMNLRSNAKPGNTPRSFRHAQAPTHFPKNIFRRRQAFQPIANARTLKLSRTPSKSLVHWG